MISVCIAFKAHLGWVNAVGVDVDAQSPTLRFARRIDLFDDDDPELASPYHVAAGWSGQTRVPPPLDPAAAVRRGLRRQAAAVAERLADLRQQLAEQRFDWARAVLLTRRGWFGDLDHNLSSHEHVHVAEGDAIRQATSAAFATLGIDAANQDEKSVGPTMEAAFGADWDAHWKALRPPVAKSWRKEERLIAAAAWLNRTTALSTPG